MGVRTAGPETAAWLHNFKLSWKLGGDQEAWPNAILNLKTEEKMDYHRRYRAQVGSLTGWVKKKVVVPGTALSLLEKPVKHLHVHL